MSKAVTKTDGPAKDTSKTLALHGPRLPYHPAIEERFGINKAAWKALVEAIFPNATTTESVILALSYCQARKLDPFKRNVHIVPIWSKDQGAMVDTVWPGIGELRTTAFRTGEYAGRCATEYGPDVTQKVGVVELTFPSWAQVTLVRMIRGEKVEFCGPRAYWLETYATRSRNDKSPNEMWATRPRGQIEKCAEAAALRAAFPEEVGGEFIPEEVQHDLGGGESAGRLNGSKVSMRSLESLTPGDITLVDEPEKYEVSEPTAEETAAAKADAEAIAREQAEIEAEEKLAASEQDK
ncbi:MAG: phage recombination protein Bet [Pirellulaceae bacterium]|nr:phage recombination protein Bet [Pirellulaceae bacterium]